jgi:hypothetical protein
LYAQQLLEVAHGQPRQIMAAALTMARRSNLSRRLRAILENEHDRSPTGRRFSAVALGAAFALVPPLAAMSPEWVRVVPPSPEIKQVPNAEVATPSLLTPQRGDSGAPSEFVIDVRPDPVQPPPAAPPAGLSVALPTHGLAAPQQAVCSPNAKRSSTNIQSNSDGSRGTRRWQVRWSDGVCRIELDARGDFTLSPNADDVVGIASGGYFDLEHDDGRVERRVRIVRGNGGDLERTYWVNGDRTAWDSEAARWLGETLILLDRRTAFAVDVRLPMLLQRGGVEAVLTEVAQMTSTYPQRIYYTKMFARASVTTEQLVRVLETASRNFDSGYEKAELLLAVAKQRSFAEPAHLAFAQMARGIESDYEKRRALSALLSRDDLKPDVVRTMLEATDGMKSDYELAELLISIDRRYAADASTRPFYVRAVSTIQSDYEQRRVLTTIMRAGELDATTTGEILRAAGRSMKGYELAEFLVQVSDKGTLNEATSTEYFNATANVGSDYERRRVLTTLVKKGQLTRGVIEGILTAAGTINSDYECAELLVTVARSTKIDDALRPAYEKAAASINSDYEYGRAMSAVRRSAQSSGH